MKKKSERAGSSYNSLDRDFIEPNLETRGNIFFRSRESLPTINLHPLANFVEAPTTLRIARATEPPKTINCRPKIVGRQGCPGRGEEVRILRWKKDASSRDASKVPADPERCLRVGIDRRRGREPSRAALRLRHGIKSPGGETRGGKKEPAESG